LISGQKIKLSVPGVEIRFGTFEKELGFDDMVRVHITAEQKKKKKRVKVTQLTEKEQFWYLAHPKDVETIDD